MKLHALACVILGCGVVAATACAPNPTKVCENLVSLMEAEGWETDVEECLEEIDDQREECEGDFNASLRCMQSASDLAEMMECAAICEGSDEEQGEAE